MNTKKTVKKLRGILENNIKYNTEDTNKELKEIVSDILKKLNESEYKQELLKELSKDDNADIIKFIRENYLQSL